MEKYIDAEKLKAEIKGLQCEQGFEDGMEERGYQFAIMDILDIIDSLQQEQPSLPDNLDEAAEEQARSFGYMKEDYEYKELIETFKAGAEWMAKQGFISEGIINQTSGEDTMIDLNEHIGYLEDCEEVIVNIRKKEKKK